MVFSERAGRSLERDGKRAGQVADDTSRAGRREPPVDERKKRAG
jgi:hypothetical protein